MYMTMNTECYKQEDILRYVRKFGNANSDAILDPQCQFFSVPHIEGVIGYRFESNCAVVFGDPACPEHQRAELVKSFHEYCDQQRRNVIYVVVSERFKSWAIDNECAATIEFGQELYLDPTNDPRKGAKGSLARRKVRKAIKSGVEVFEYQGYDPELEKQMEELGNRWLANRKGPQLHISHVNLFENRLGKRWFYATCNGEVIGVVVLNEIKARGGWLLNRLMMAPNSPGGTPEILVITALDQLASEDCHYVTFGGIPGDEIGEIGGFGNFTQWLVPKMYQLSLSLFKLGGKGKFWEKFQPEAEKSYLLFREPSLSPGKLIGLMRALNLSM